VKKLLRIGAMVLCLSLAGQTIAAAKPPENGIRIVHSKITKKKDESLFLVYLDNIKGNALAEDIQISFNPDDYILEDVSSLDDEIPILGSKSSKGSIRIIMASLGTKHAIHGDKAILEVLFKNKTKKGKSPNPSIAATVSDEYGNELVLSAK